MNTGEILALFRTEVSDIEKPYLWTDEEALAYLNDAYTMLVRFMGGVPDSTSNVTELTASIGATDVAISDAIIKIVRAFRVSDGAEVSVIENTDVPLVRNAAGKLSLLRVGSQTGPVEYVIVGAGRNSVAFHPVPDANDTLKLQVRRIPLVQLAADADELADVGEEHHIHLMKWMKSMAYRKQDADTLDLDKAQLNESLFLQYCGQATHEQERMRRKSRVSLRSERDVSNPMLSSASVRAYGGTPSPEQQQRRREG